ncbi:hypothetical protein ACOME3_009869 [Neoechinorhynchus agilis]
MIKYDDEFAILNHRCRVLVNVEYTIEQANDEGQTSQRCDGDYRKHGYTMSKVYEEIGIPVVHPILSCVNENFCAHKKIKDGIKIDGACVQSHEAFGQLTFVSLIDYQLPCDSSIRLLFMPGTNLYVFGGKDASVTAYMSKSTAFLYTTIKTLYRSDRLLNSSPQIGVVPQYLVAHSVTEPLIVRAFDPNEVDTIKCRWPFTRLGNLTECVHPDEFSPTRDPKSYEIDESGCAIRDYLNSFYGVKVDLFANCSLAVYFPKTFIGRTYHFTIMAEDFRSGESNPMSVVPFAFMLRVTSTTETRRAALIFSDSRDRISLSVNEVFRQNVTCHTYCAADTLKCVQTMTRISIMPYPEFISVTTLKDEKLNDSWKLFYKEMVVSPKTHHCSDKYQVCAYCSDAYSHSHINCQIFEVTKDENQKPCLPPLLKPRCPLNEVYCGIAYNNTCVSESKLKEACLKCELYDCNTAGEFKGSFYTKGHMRHFHSSLDNLSFGKAFKISLGLLFGLLFMLFICIILTCKAVSDYENDVSTSYESTDTNQSYYTGASDGKSAESVGIGKFGSKISALQATDEEELT